MARAWTRTTRSGVERTNHDATALKLIGPNSNCEQETCIWWKINSQMIGLVFSINFSTPLLNQTEQRTCLECFQTLSIEKCVPCLFVLNPCANRQHPHRWLSQHPYLFGNIYSSQFIYTNFRVRIVVVLILHNKTPIKVCETKGVKYFKFRDKTLNINKWRLKQLVF